LGEYAITRGKAGMIHRTINLLQLLRAPQEYYRRLLLMSTKEQMRRLRSYR
jgi:hypothetical protein